MIKETTLSLSIKKHWSWKEFFFQWEWLLVLIFISVIVICSILSPYFLSVNVFLSAPMSFLDKAFIVFPMMMVIMLGRIDISVGSNVALTSVLMGVLFNAGLPMPAAIITALIIGSLLGAFTGLVQIKFPELPAMIVTLSTMTIYRGVAWVILEDRASRGFPDWFSFFAWGTVGHFPFILIVFAIAAIISAVVVHKTGFGRTIYGMGSNLLACKYSGIKTNRVLMIVSIFTGFMCGVCAIFLASRMGSVRPNIAIGYELEVIAMVVLGGVSTSGGTGRIAGPLLAIFIVGYLTFGLGLMNIASQALLVVIGLLLILSVLAMNVRIKKGKSPSLAGVSK